MQKKVKLFYLKILFKLLSIIDIRKKGIITKRKILVGILIIGMIQSITSCRAKRTCYVVAIDPDMYEQPADSTKATPDEEEK